jgi:glycerol-1-phosphate dehydrogenase [NAD(P)+]
MSLYSQIAYHPIIFQVGSNNLGSIRSILDSKNLSFKNILLLTGATHSLEIASDINFDYIKSHEIVSNNSFDEVQRLSQKVYNHNFDLIIALGGGKVLDVAKRVSLDQRINHLSIPTIISNDGLISPISVLTNDKGFTESVPGQMPMGVIIDMNIISSSPVQYIQAAAGDILSNMSATNDWDYAFQNHNEKMNDIGFQLSRMSAHSLIYFDNIDTSSEEFLKMIIQGQVNSGIAMGLAGTSRPCSGSEHLLSHAIDYLGLSSDTLHGFQVGSLSLFCLYLQDKLKEEHIRYGKKLNMAFDFFKDKNIPSEQMKEVFKKSRTMRPGRNTILDKFSNFKIVDKYKKFTELIYESTIN